MNENLACFVVGLLFGTSLDLAGFGSAKKMNALFLLKDFSMFKVMFGAISVASLLYQTSVSFNLSLPAPEVLVPSVNLSLLVGGLLLGVGLVIGGYCPGTALVGAAGGRYDAFIFLLMIYPGYCFWSWVEPKLKLNLHTSLAQENLTLPDLLGLQKYEFTVVMFVSLVFGWWISAFILNKLTK